MTAVNISPWTYGLIGLSMMVLVLGGCQRRTAQHDDGEEFQIYEVAPSAPGSNQTLQMPTSTPERNIPQGAKRFVGVFVPDAIAPTLSAKRTLSDPTGPVTRENSERGFDEAFDEYLTRGLDVYQATTKDLPADKRKNTEFVQHAYKFYVGLMQDWSVKQLYDYAMSKAAPGVVEQQDPFVLVTCSFILNSYAQSESAVAMHANRH